MQPESAYQHINVNVDRDVLVIQITERQVEGDLVSEALRHEMLEAFEKANLHQIVVDFERTAYISSVAFRPLLHLRRRLTEKGGGRIILCNLSQEIGDVFYTTRLISPDGSFSAPFELEGSVASAVNKMKSVL